eukprot:763981-Hanusia_phi.AAC.4
MNIHGNSVVVQPELCIQIDDARKFDSIPVTLCEDVPSIIEFFHKSSELSRADSITSTPPDPFSVEDEQPAKYEETLALLQQRVLDLESTCKKASVQSLQSLDMKVKSMIEGLETSPNLSVLFTVKPFLASLTKWPTKILVAFASTLFGYNCIKFAMRISSLYKGHEGSLLRLSQFQVRESKHGRKVNFQVGSAGLMMHERLLTWVPCNMTSTADAMVLNCSEHVRWNGIYFTARPGLAESDMLWAEFDLESVDRGRGFAQSWSGQLEHAAGSAGLYAMPRGPVQYGGVYDQMWLLAYSVALLLSIAGFVNILLKHYLTAKYCLIIGIYTLYITLIPAALIEMDSAENLFSRIVICLSRVFQWVTGTIFAFSLHQEKYVVLGFSILGLGNTVNQICNLAFRIRQFVLMNLMFQGIVVLAIAVLMAFLLKSIRARSRNMMRADFEKYESIYTTNFSLADLEVLSKEIGYIQRLMGDTRNALRHTRRRLPQEPLQEQSSQTASNSFWWTSPLVVDNWTTRSTAGCESQPVGSLSATISSKLRLGSAATPDDFNTAVTSLDQIYLHATFIQHLFRRKVYEIARRSKGLLQRKLPRNNGSFGSLKRLNPDANKPQVVLASSDLLQYADVEWSKRKSASRGVEKVVRCYDGDSSRLVDVCRESIIFHHLRDIVVAVRSIKLDKDISVRRIKNRLDPNMDPWSTAGYRDVSTNLCIVSQEAYNLGLEGHVCELLLIPKDMHDIKIESGHRKYVAWRNLRGQ